MDWGKLVTREVQRISKEEVRAAVKRMKSGNTVGPDDIPVEVCRCAGSRFFCLTKSWEVRGWLRDKEEVYWYMFSRTS